MFRPINKDDQVQLGSSVKANVIAFLKKDHKKKINVEIVKDLFRGYKADRRENDLSLREIGLLLPISTDDTILRKDLYHLIQIGKKGLRDKDIHQLRTLQNSMVDAVKASDKRYLFQDDEFTSNGSESGNGKSLHARLAAIEVETSESSQTTGYLQERLEAIEKVFHDGGDEGDDNDDSDETVEEVNSPRPPTTEPPTELTAFPEMSPSPPKISPRKSSSIQLNLQTRRELGKLEVSTEMSRRNLAFILGKLKHDNTYTEEKNHNNDFLPVEKLWEKLYPPARLRYLGVAATSQFLEERQRAKKWCAQRSMHSGRVSPYNRFITGILFFSKCKGPTELIPDIEMKETVLQKLKRHATG
eukprot:g1863.t1